MVKLVKSSFFHGFFLHEWWVDQPPARLPQDAAELEAPESSLEEFLDSLAQQLNERTEKGGIFMGFFHGIFMDYPLVMSK